MRYGLHLILLGFILWLWGLWLRCLKKFWRVLIFYLRLLRFCSRSKYSTLWRVFNSTGFHWFIGVNNFQIKEFKKRSRLLSLNSVLHFDIIKFYHIIDRYQKFSLKQILILCGHIWLIFVGLDKLLSKDTLRVFLEVIFSWYQFFSLLQIEFPFSKRSHW